MFSQILSLHALDIANGIKNREYTSSEVTRAFLDSIESKNKELNAFITINETALSDAKLIDEKIMKGEISSPLMGVPVSVKDNIVTKDLLTTAGSKMLSDFYPPYDATVVTKLKSSGMVILGKTNMDEFGMGSTSETSFYGATKNPFDLKRVAGGSSGGAAASVSGKMSPVSLGTDTGGSVRLPSAYCGVLGIKPTYGRVSRYGLIAYASSFDQIGVIGNSSSDLGAMLNIISGPDSKDQTSYKSSEISLENISNKDISGLKIGVPLDYLESGVDEVVLNNLKAAVEKLQTMGASVSYFNLNASANLISAYYVIAFAEASSNLSRYDGIRFGFNSKDHKSLEELYVNNRTSGFGSEVKRRIMLGNYILSEGFYDRYYKKALSLVNMAKKSFSESFLRFDALLLPVSGDVAPKLNAFTNNPVDMYKGDEFTVLANICGLPSIAVPSGFKNGMPTSVQLIADKYQEELLLKISESLMDGEES